MQNARWWYPPVEDRSELLPLLPPALTATYQYVTPQSIDASLEDAQLIDVAGDSMVLVVAGDHTPKPYTDLTGTIMLTSVITLKPAIRYHFKTGQRDWPKT